MAFKVYSRYNDDDNDDDDDDDVYSIIMVDQGNEGEDDISSRQYSVSLQCVELSKNTVLQSLPYGNPC